MVVPTLQRYEMAPVSPPADGRVVEDAVRPCTRVNERAEGTVQFPTALGSGGVRGILERPAGEPLAGLIVTHGRSGNMTNPLVRRTAQAAADSGLIGLRMNFRYVDERGKASRDLSREEDDLRGAVTFLRQEVGTKRLFVAGQSMGARVCARASSDPDIAGVIALGYPLHPRFRPEVQNPPEWPLLVKPALFVQGDQDPFCNLARLREDLPKLQTAYELVVIAHAGHSFESRGPRRDTFPEVRDATMAWILRRT